MTELPGDTIKNLVALSKVDGMLAIIVADRKRRENELLTMRKQQSSIEGDVSSKARFTDDKRTRYEKEAKTIADERERLVQRRKSLSTLNNYKVQQSADKEIQSASRDLDKRAEIVEQLKKEFVLAEQQLNQSKQQLEQIVAKQRVSEEDTLQALRAAEERQAEYAAQREKLIGSLAREVLGVYEKLVQRYPQGPISSATKTACSSCFQQLGPQVIVQMQRGEALVRCPGCGRILYLEENIAAA